MDNKNIRCITKEEKALYMQSIYKPRMLKGWTFQDFTMLLLLFKRGIVVTNFQSPFYQFSFGENPQGFEIKYDRNLSETGNIFIEVMQRRFPEKEEYYPSSLLKNDNSWMYLIGNYSKILSFSKKTLRNYMESYIKEEMLKENRQKTGIGFLLGKGEQEFLKEFLLVNDCIDIPTDIWEV